MNKRARLTRRILREHRANWPWHMTRLADGTHRHWLCPHCKRGWEQALLEKGSGHAYR